MIINYIFMIYYYDIYDNILFIDIIMIFTFYIEYIYLPFHIFVSYFYILVYLFKFYFADNVH